MSSFLWERFCTDGSLNDEGKRAGGVLAALRRGAHLEPGSTPELWTHYTQLDDAGGLTSRLRAEHICLTTYGVHQQSVTWSAHNQEAELGDALRALRQAGKFSEDAVDRHVMRLGTAQQMDEVSHHLVALVNLMKATKRPLGFNYTQLFYDLTDLQNELRASRVRRRWGAAYFRPDAHDTTSRSQS